MKRILAVTSVLLLMLTLLAVPAAGSGGTFTDDDNSIFEPDIEWLVAQEITKGCNAEGTLFCPDDPVTRGQMAAFLVRALGYTDNGGGNLFTDDDNSIFETAIDMLATAGVTKGCNAEGTLFCPDDPVTRGQMAAFLHRSVGGITPTTTTAATPPPPTSTTTTTSPPTASLDQSGFALYDDGTESGATRRGEIDQYWWVPANTPVLTRFLVSETNGGSTALTVKLQYQVRTSNAGYGPWTDVNASSSNVRSIASPNVTEGGTTTERIHGPDTFVAGRIDEVDGVTATAVSLSGNDETEFLFAVEFLSADLAEGNSVHLRLVESDGTPLDAYSQVPTYTIETDYVNTFDGQTDEDDVTTTNLANSGDAPDQVMQPDGATSNIIKYDTDVAAHGTSSVRVDNTTGIGTARFRWNDRYLNQVYLRFYIRLDALPSSTLTIVQIDDEPGDQMFRMQVNNSGQVTVRAGGGGKTTYTTTNSLSTDGSWDRIEVALIPEYGGASNGVIDLRLFLGSDAENALNLPTEQAVFDVTDSVTFGGETVFDQFDVPYVRAGFPGFHIDELAFRNTDWWGPTTP